MAHEADDSNEAEVTTSEGEQRPVLHWMLDETNRPTALSQLEAIALALFEPHRLAKPAQGQSFAERVHKIATDIHAHERLVDGQLVSDVRALHGEKVIRAIVDRWEREADTREREKHLWQLAWAIEELGRRQLSEAELLEIHERSKRRSDRPADTGPWRFMAELRDKGVADLTGNASTRRRISKRASAARIDRPASAVPRLVEHILHAEDVEIEGLSPSLGAWRGQSPEARLGLRYAAEDLVGFFLGFEPENRSFFREIAGESANALSDAARRTARRLADAPTCESDSDVRIYLSETRRLWALTHGSDHAWFDRLRNCDDDLNDYLPLTCVPRSNHSLFADGKQPAYVEGIWLRAITLPTVMLEVAKREFSAAEWEIVLDLSDRLPNGADDDPEFGAFAHRVHDGLYRWLRRFVLDRPAEHREHLMGLWASNLTWAFDSRVQAVAYDDHGLGAPNGVLDRVQGLPGVRDPCDDPQEPKVHHGRLVARSDLAAVLERRATILLRALELIGVIAEDGALNRPSEPTG